MIIASSFWVVLECCTGCELATVEAVLVTEESARH